MLAKFEDFLKEGSFNVVSWNWVKNVPYDVTVTNGKENYRLVVYLKNISGAGWKEKPHIKRVQVTNVRNDDMDKYIDTTSSETLLILGYYNFDENPIMVAWNAYQYVQHNTNRSCYVNLEHLQEGYKNGMYITTCAEQKIWVFKPESFQNFLKDYIKANKWEK